MALLWPFPPGRTPAPLFPSYLSFSWEYYQSVSPLLKTIKSRDNRCVRSSMANVPLLGRSWTSGKSTITNLRFRCTSNTLGCRILIEDSPTKSTSSATPRKLLNLINSWPYTQLHRLQWVHSTHSLGFFVRARWAILALLGKVVGCWSCWSPDPLPCPKKY